MLIIRNSKIIGTALSEIPESHYIGLAGLAANQLPVNAAAIAMGYGVRVGIEDNIWWDVNRSRNCNNIELVKRMHALIEINQKVFFKPKEFGELGFRNNEA
ncbi:MAG: 3-keto-5-aminohexanoate cleavage protein [Flavobacteriaceae bacterium]|nr:3-keto-5-aminohexanoate cleavage protein [Flavobacteriaceae bacterium]